MTKHFRFAARIIFFTSCFAGALFSVFAVGAGVIVVAAHVVGDETAPLRAGLVMVPVGLLAALCFGAGMSWSSEP